MNNSILAKKSDAVREILTKDGKLYAEVIQDKNFVIYKTNFTLCNVKTLVSFYVLEHPETLMVINFGKIKNNFSNTDVITTLNYLNNTYVDYNFYLSPNMEICLFIYSYYFKEERFNPSEILTCLNSVSRNFNNYEDTKRILSYLGSGGEF